MVPTTVLPSSGLAHRSPSRATSGSRQFTPSTESAYDQDDPNPDIPLPSVEADDSSRASRESSTSPVLYTPATTSRISASVQGSIDQALLHGLDNITISSGQERLSSSDRVPPRVSDASPTPSIEISTPEPTRTPSQTGTLLNEFNNLSLHEVRPITSTNNTRRNLYPEHQNDRRTQSPSASRRRRSSSAANSLPHKVEDEAPPLSHVHDQKIREALEDSRQPIRSLVSALSRHGLYREAGSAIHKLHEQAISLSGFEPPSTRIVGLVGDSGVGKSSLINSLLDTRELARAVSLRNIQVF
jgi:hypothetical protein